VKYDSGKTCPEVKYDLAMIGSISGGGVYATRVFLTNLDVTGSLNHSCMYNTNNVHPTNKQKKKNNK